MNKIVFILALLTSFILSAYYTKDEGGDFPHGHAYMKNPNIDKDPILVKLFVDKSGYLENNYIHMIRECTPGFYEKVLAKDVNLIFSNVFYHAEKTINQLISWGFPPLTSPLQIIISYTDPNLIKINYENNVIIFGKKALTKHVYDADIIKSAIIRFYLVKFYFNKTQLSTFSKSLVVGISYYLTCSLSNTPVYASYVENRDLKSINKSQFADANFNAHKIAMALWHLRELINDDTTTLIFDSLLVNVSNIKTMNEYVRTLLYADAARFDKKHFDIIINSFNGIEFTSN